MTAAEARARLLAKRSVAVEHDGVTYSVRAPSLAESRALSQIADVMQREAAMLSMFVTVEGAALFEKAEDALDMDVGATVLIEKVKAALAEFASYGAPDAAPAVEGNVATNVVTGLKVPIPAQDGDP